MHIKHQLQRWGNLKGCHCIISFLLSVEEKGKGQITAIMPYLHTLKKASPCASQPSAFKGVVTIVKSLGFSYPTPTPRATLWNPSIAHLLHLTPTQSLVIASI